jgi:prepilin-type N-terminal cleavage/methylation domain-containing protein
MAMSRLRAMLSGSRGRGFTLLELIVAVGISVVLISILTFVFRVATSASRNANSRVSLTERLRSLNLRMRQEIGGMVHAVRGNTLTYDLRYFFGYSTGSPALTPARTRGCNGIAFAASTVQDGKPVTVDVAYVFEPGVNPDSGESEPERGMLIRLRDRTGPDADAVPLMEGATKVYYTLGDDRWVGRVAGTNYRITFSDIPTSAAAGAIKTFNAKIYTADIMMTNVRDVEFFAIDPPPTTAVAATQLSPRTLPAGIKLNIVYGPEVGEIDMLEREEIFFPVHRGL